VKRRSLMSNRNYIYLLITGGIAFIVVSQRELLFEMERYDGAIPSTYLLDPFHPI
jgi:hypothetical protein